MRYYKAQTVKTTRNHGVEVNKYTKKLPYNYNSIIMVDGFAGIQGRHPGIAMNEIRCRFNLSRKNFAALCCRESKEFAGYVSMADIRNYEDGKCCPKRDKFEAILRAIMFLTGMPKDDAERYVAGFTEATTARKW